MMDEIEKSQLEICQEYGVNRVLLDFKLKLSVSEDFFSSSEVLINGFRRSPEGNTCGWFLWKGEEMSDSEISFRQINVTYLIGHCHQVIPYLGLPTGWRFLVAGGHGRAWPD
jgi:hypothetical protein